MDQWKVGAVSMLSDIRRELAEAVASGKVIYYPGRATWFIDEVEATGWKGRHLREMRDEELISAPRPRKVTSSTQVRATLTAHGRDELAATMGDTPHADA